MAAALCGFGNSFPECGPGRLVPIFRLFEAMLGAAEGN